MTQLLAARSSPNRSFSLACLQAFAQIHVEEPRLSRPSNCLYLDIYRPYRPESVVRVRRHVAEQYWKDQLSR